MRMQGIGALICETKKRNQEWSQVYQPFIRQARRVIVMDS